MKNNLIITADHDLLQAVDADNDVIIATTGILVNAENFEQIKGVPIDKYVLFKSVLGDKSDNVIGLSGYGAVKAKNLCLTENATNSLNQEQNDIIENNKKIVDLQWAYDNFLEEHTFYEKQLLSPSILTKNF
jgi:5'-3' exonuclease